MATEIHEEHATRRPGRRGLMHWGAIFAGLSMVLALTWVLYLFGAAIGVSVLDASDGDAMGSGFGITTIVWMIISSLIVFFIASFVAGYLSGEHDSETGMLHGGTLWAVATSLMLLLGWMGVSALAHAGVSVVKTTVSTTASAVGSAASGTADAAGALAQGAWSMRDSAVADSILAKLKEQSAEYAASGASGVSAAEAERAINQLDDAAVRRIAEQIAAGDTAEARATLASETTLSERQVAAMVSGISRDLQGRLGTAQDGTGLAADVLGEVKSGLAAQAARLDQPGGVRVSEAQITGALNDLDAQAARTIAMRLVQGDVEGAKTSLAANTSLSRAQINELVDGAEAEVQAIVADYRETAEEYADTAADYAQGVLWTSFLASIAGLAVSIVGGWLGTRNTPLLLNVERTRVRTATA